MLTFFLQNMNTLHSDIIKAEDVPINGADLLKITDGKTRIVLYEELTNMTGRDFVELFVPETNWNIILLYRLLDSNHWITIILGDECFYHYDSYGLQPDEELDMIHHTNKHLTRLYQESGIKVKHNVYRHQMIKDHVNTCGRHSALRAIHYNLSNAEYHFYMTHRNPHKVLNNMDDLVSLMTMTSLKYTEKS